jgi:hypothetical protein
MADMALSGSKIALNWGRNGIELESEWKLFEALRAAVGWSRAGS